MSGLGEIASRGKRRFGESFSQSTHRLTAGRAKASQRGGDLNRKCNGVDQNGGHAAASKRQAAPSHYRRRKVLVGDPCVDVDRHRRRRHAGKEIGVNPQTGHQADHEGRETEES
ncbi:hypothetical protein CN172_29795 [Sinorhizobium meliloti]|nr:hypothetical protein CN232_31460 [Sinorhizobium meliloti]RVH36924.1 hypothetical protein CN208_31600 [Sinorhizobium meliloti]RVK05908.1 hypothetical protein CN172_29795 [Sinorhizobium meliloti]